MKSNLLLISVLLSAFLFGCKKTDPNADTGIVKGIIKNVSNTSVISTARVVVFDANTNAPTANSVFTDNSGLYSFTLSAVTYYVSVSKLGFESVPPLNISAVPFTIVAQQTVKLDLQMYPMTITGLGTISGTVTESSNPSAGVLVVASGTSNGYSSVSDKDGNYWIYNVPAGTYPVKAWKSGFNSSGAYATLASSGESQNNNLTLASGTSGSVTGSVSFLATTNIEVDVSLVNPQTRETIPGLTTKTTGENYTITNIPAGTYIARASYESDGKVVDPDWIVKNGEPVVTVGTASATMNFSVTGAVSLTSPTSAATSAQPASVSSTTPTFTWLAYPSTDNYIIEVSDVNGKVVWGGFNNKGTLRNLVIPKTATTIIYNNNGAATESLQNGHVYRWRIYASKDDSSDPRGWKLISVSEEQQGLIKIAQKEEELLFVRKGAVIKAPFLFIDNYSLTNCMETSHNQ